ncbi:MAG: hypothetical protein KGQ59_05075 [Bdellovibrionales bacterium]|nr:hypothetical protein [Bdellovibrionales bacterium]
MKRSSSRKTAAPAPDASTESGIERRRRPRSQKNKKQSPIRTPSSQDDLDQESCSGCGKSLTSGDRALFVEEELGRTFCGEDCISEYFSPEVERLEAEYQSLLTGSDLKPKEREELAHLRWSTLKEPDEVWREKTLSGDYRYTLIAEFRPLDKPIWCVCLSLFLRGEPSFLFLSIFTRNAALVDRYRRGERMSWIKRSEVDTHSAAHPKPTEEQIALDGTVIPADEMGLVSSSSPTDGLADGWSTDEAVRAALGAGRSAEDIPSEEFSAYQSCLEETLEAPDEVWMLVAEQSEPTDAEDSSVKMFHFVRYYEGGETPFWYVIIAKEASDGEHLEVLEAFPTRDEELVDRYRQGSLEVGGDEHSEPVTRVLH